MHYMRNCSSVCARVHAKERSRQDLNLIDFRSADNVPAVNAHLTNEAREATALPEAWRLALPHGTVAPTALGILPLTSSSPNVQPCPKDGEGDTIYSRLVSEPRCRSPQVTGTFEPPMP